MRQLNKMRPIHLTLLATIGLAGINTDAGAEVYPSRPITMVVPFPAGGPLDTLARILAEHMRASLSQTIIIENVTGGSGSAGTGRVARASRDGYTLGLGNTATHVINGAALQLAYDVRSEFEPISLLTSQPMLIVAKKTMPAKDLREFIVWLKENPDQASQGTGGPGSTGHYDGLLFQKETGTRFRFVPYRGITPAMQDLMAGRIDMMFDLASNSLPQVRAGSIRAYAVTAKNRFPAAPDIPTVEDAGLPGFHTSSWYSLWAPKGTPKAIIAKLNAAVVEALADAAVRMRLGDLGQEIFPREQQTPEALATLHKAEIEKWWPIIKAANVKAE
jgi:tripartite-type tricarboxylate transporter receptor subunit TctC